MATIFTHPVVALCSLPWFSRLHGKGKILITGMVMTIIPDLDVLGFYFGVPYQHPIGHRGITHSLFFALCISGIIAYRFSQRSIKDKGRIWAYLFICMSSHGIIDALTNGGLGIALFAPFSNERYFFPWQPIEVSPIGIRPFLSSRGLTVILNELLWIWIPGIVIGLAGITLRTVRR